MEIIQKDIHVFYENETYYRREKIFGTVSNIRWFFGTSYIRLELEQKLEEEYQKTLIPTKTLNPSEERGFDITRLSILIENLQKDKYFVRNNSKEYKYGFEHALILVKGSINDILAYQANGEKPEVVNPVGQDDLRKTIEILLMYYSEANGGTTDNIQEYTDKFLKAIKPRETDKEEPKTKYYEYKTSLHTDLLTANNPENKHLIHWKRVRVPSNHNSINDTMFIEFITGDFVLDLRVIDKF